MGGYRADRVPRGGRIVVPPRQQDQLRFLARFATSRHVRWLLDKRLSARFAAARYTRPNTRTPQQADDAPEAGTCRAARGPVRDADAGRAPGDDGPPGARTGRCRPPPRRRWTRL